MRYLSVCSGIEAASVAWHPLGWVPVAFAEIERFPSAVLAHHYPGVPNWGDMTRYQEWPDVAVDVVVGGTPCQSFSVAGLRAGLADPRGNLALVFLAVVDRYRPRWVVWENVPGVRSASDGRDFGAFLGGLAELGYGWAYRSLDAQYFGLAQRRERVFVVAHRGDWRPPAAVLFEPESLSGDSAPRRDTGEGTAPTLASRPTGGGGLGTDFDCDGGLIHLPEIVPQAMSAKWAKGPSGPSGDECANLVTHALQADGFDASEDGTGRGTPLVVDTLTSNGDAHSGYRDEKGLVAVDLQQVTSQVNRSQPTPESPPLTTHGTVVAVRTANTGANGHGVATEVAHTLDGAKGQALADPGNTLNPQMAVRRLTPRECERLQGFPDDYTLVPYRGKPTADGPRYKALGNSMAVPVMRWLGARMALVESVQSRGTTEDAA